MIQLVVKMGYSTVFGIARKNENWCNLSRTQGSVRYYSLYSFLKSQVLEITRCPLWIGVLLVSSIRACKCSKSIQNVGVVVGKIGVLREVRPIEPLDSLSRDSSKLQIKFNIIDRWPFWPFQHVQGGVLG